MKKLWIFLLFILAFTSCNKSEIEYIFDKSPEQKVGELLTALQSELLSSPYGWKASLNTNASGGYGFYMNFKEDQTIEMLSDFSTAASNTLKKSTYRVTWTMNAALIFDTYNYITLLQDPTPSVNGGSSGNGLQSDVEFELVSIEDNSILLKGKRYSNLLKLVKLSEAEQKQYIEGGYTNSVNSVNNYFSSHQNNYLNVNGVSNLMEFVLTTTKGVVFQYVHTDGSVVSVTGKFNYELGGVNFNVPITVGDQVFIKGVLEGQNFYVYNINNEKFKISQHTQPILPIETLFAYNKTYNAIHINRVLPLGITSDFNATYERSLGLFDAMNPARHILQCYFKLTSATKAEVGIQNQVKPNGTTYATGLATYDYKMSEEGEIVLSNPIYDSNFSARATQLAPIRDFFITPGSTSKKFKLSYIQSNDPSVSNIGGLVEVDKPTNFYYGSLRKM